jgi:cytoskeletal protein RodZ
MSEEQSISQQLCQARQQQHKDLEEVHRHTGLSLAVLRGLEGGKFDVVEPVFVRLALRAYAEYLGLNADEVLAQYDRTLGPPASPAPQAPASSAPQTPAWPLAIDSSILRTLALGGGGLLAVLLVVQLFEDDPIAQVAPIKPQAAQSLPGSRGMSGPPETAKEEGAALEGGEQAAAKEDRVGAALEELEEQAATEQKAGAAQESAEQVPEAEVPVPARAAPAAQEQKPASLQESPAPGSGEQAAPAAPPEASLVLEVEAVDSTWVQVRWDGNGLFEGIVPSGERRRWRARDYFLVHSGRAHGLRYWFQGQLLGDGFLGEPTRVLRFRASEEGVRLLGADLQPLPGAAPATGQP